MKKTEENNTLIEGLYKTFIEQSSEGIWRFELEEPLSVLKPINTQIKFLYKHVYLADCNNAMAKMYGFKKSSDIVGARMGEFLPQTNKKNISYLREFVTSEYKLTGALSFAHDRYGKKRIFQNNLVGVVEKERLIRAWGTQRDITQEYLMRERQEFLEKINNKLTVSLDSDIALKDIAKLIVPYLADYCRIAVVDEKGKISEIAVNHKNSAKITLAKDLYESYNDLPDVRYGVPALLKKGKPEILSIIDDKVLERVRTNKRLIRNIKNIGLKSYMGVPLIVRGKVKGAITFSSIQNDRRYSKDDLKFAQELSKRIALMLDNVRLFKGAQNELKERKSYEQKLNLLLETSKIIPSSLDYRTTLTNVAKAAVPVLADWCSIDILEGKDIQQLTLAHKDPQKVKWAKVIRKRFPIEKYSPLGIPNVIKTAKSELYPFVTDELLNRTVQDKRFISLIKKMGIKSVMLVPIIIGKKAIGAISFVSTQRGRYYTETDLAMAEEVASHAALAVENSRLYTESQKALALREDFISIASHELKTPITSLKMYNQVIQKQLELKNEPELCEYLMRMEMQIDKLTGLINDLLNVTKMQQGKLDFKVDRFDLVECINEVIENVRSISNKHTFVINGALDKKVWGDRDRIGQVMTNLLMNAVKYSPNSEKVIISITSDKSNVVIGVQDFGIGIDREHQKKIFERFYRVDSSDEKTFPGLGMGLYISNEIVKRHNGKMNVVSEKGKGSRFSFTIPFSQPRENFENQDLDPNN